MASNLKPETGHMPCNVSHLSFSFSGRPSAYAVFPPPAGQMFILDGCRQNSIEAQIIDEEPTTEQILVLFSLKRDYNSFYRHHLSMSGRMQERSKRT